VSEQTEEEYLIERLSKLLAEISVIVNGPQPPLTRWSYHDLPEKVRALKQAQQPQPQAGVEDENAAWLKWKAERGDNWTTAEAFNFRRAFIDGYRASLGVGK
jgi:hypothetical protein